MGLKKGVDIMRFFTHVSTPKVKTKRSVTIMLAIEWGLMIAFFVFVAIVMSLEARRIAPAIVLLMSAMLACALFIIIPQKDMDRAYIEINDDTVTVVDYYLGIKKEKTFAMRDIARAEILLGSSICIRGYRFSMTGFRYIVFYDNNSNFAPHFRRRSTH